MSNDTEPRAPRTDGAAPVDGLDDQAALSPGQVLMQVYAFFYKKSVGLVLLLLTGLLSLLGVLFAQMPSDLKNDPQATARWLEQARQVYGGWTDVLHKAGVLHMFSSVPFLIVMGLLAVSIIACTVHRLPIIWRAARHPRIRVTTRFFDRARLRSRFTAPIGAEKAFEIVCADARRHRMRVITHDRGPGRNAYIDRFRWGPFGTVLAHTAFVIIMAGFVVSSLTGFRDQQFTLTVGYPKEVGHGTTLTAEAKGFQDTYYDDGSPKDYVADLVVYDDGRQVAGRQVRVNSPLSYDGVMFHQAYFGVAAVLSITDSSGTEVFHDGVALERTTKDKKLIYGRTTLPDGNTLFVVGSASGQTDTGIEPGQVGIEIYEGDAGDPIDRTTLDTGVPTSLGGYTFTFEREQQFTGMTVRRDPGTGIVWLGFLLLFVGTCMTMLARHRRMWVRVTRTDDGTLVQMASPDRQDSGFTRFFTDMAVRVSSDMSAAAGEARGGDDAGENERSDERDTARTHERNTADD